MVLAVETAARALPDAVGTVGEIAVRPGAKNVVPGECVFSLDLRARSEETVEQLGRDVRAAIRRIGDARGVKVLDRRSIARRGGPARPEAPRPVPAVGEGRRGRGARALLRCRTRR